MSEEKKWIVYKKARLEYTPGMLAHWSGLDGYVNGSWVDRIKGYKLTPTDIANFAYVSSGKYYHNTSYASYMKSNFTPGNGAYTVEVACRNLKSVTGNYRGSGIWANGTGTLLVFSSYDGPQLFRFSSSGMRIGGCYKLSSGTHYGATVSKLQSSMVANELDTITYGSKCHAWNGVRQGNGANNSQSNYIGGTLTIGSCNSQTGRAVTNLKIHSIRFYPFVLTEEQIAHNWKCDQQWYNL